MYYTPVVPTPVHMVSIRLSRYLSGAQRGRQIGYLTPAHGTSTPRPFLALPFLLIETKDETETRGARGRATQDHKLGRNTDVDWNTLVERYRQELQGKTQPLTQPSDDQLTQPNGPP